MNQGGSGLDVGGLGHAKEDPRGNRWLGSRKEGD
jgi:hypothetical protein